MRAFWAAAVLCVAVVAVLVACTGLGAGRAPEPAAPPAAWQYPIAAGVWYPCDDAVPEHAFRYYKVRCWPGCHDPNSQPQPHP